MERETKTMRLRSYCTFTVDQRQSTMYRNTHTHCKCFTQNTQSVCDVREWRNALCMWLLWTWSFIWAQLCRCLRLCKEWLFSVLIWLTFFQSSGFFSAQIHACKARGECSRMKSNVKHKPFSGILNISYRIGLNQFRIEIRKFRENLSSMSICIEVQTMWNQKTHYLFSKPLPNSISLMPLLLLQLSQWLLIV